MYYKIVNNIGGRYYSPFITTKEFIVGDNYTGIFIRTEFNRHKNIIRTICPQEYFINNYTYDNDFLCVYRNLDDVLSYLYYYCGNKLPNEWSLFKCEIDTVVEPPYYVHRIDFPDGTVFVKGVKLVKEVRL